MNNLFFISGPQGAGKTTLVDLLSSMDQTILIPSLETSTVKLDTNPLDRQALKICQKSLENFEYLQIAESNPDKIIIGNRCIYDNIAFNRVYFRRGWISKEQEEQYNLAANILYLKGLHKPKAIVLNPGFEIVMEHLHKRWQSKEMKWREDDELYIRYACEEYEKLKENPKVIYIDHEINIDDDSEAEGIIYWMNKKELIKL